MMVTSMDRSKAGLGAVHPLGRCRLPLMDRLMWASECDVFWRCSPPPSKTVQVCTDGLKMAMSMARHTLAPDHVYWWSLAPWKGLQDTVLWVPGLRTELPQLVSLAWRRLLTD